MTYRTSVVKPSVTYFGSGGDRSRATARCRNVYGDTLADELPTARRACDASDAGHRSRSARAKCYQSSLLLHLVNADREEGAARVRDGKLLVKLAVRLLQSTGFVECGDVVD